MANPIILIAAAAGAVYLFSNKKKSTDKKAAASIIDKGTYSYSSDCKHLWVGGVDIASSDVVKLTKEQNEAMNRFVSNAVVPAIVAEANSKTDPSWDDQPFAITEWALGAIARIVPGCEYKEGKPANATAAALLPLTMAHIELHVIQSGGNMNDFAVMIAAEMIWMARAHAESKGKPVDIIKFIRQVRENPDRYTVTQEEIQEWLSQRKGSQLGS